MSSDSLSGICRIPQAEFGSQTLSGHAPNDGQEVAANPRRVLFPRSSRLSRHADFEKVYKQGRRHFASHSTVFYLLRAEGDGLRVGLTVGRVLGGAVDRNRIKRRMREALRLRWPAQSLPVDVVINPKKSVLKVATSELESEIERAFAVIQNAVGRAFGSQ